MSISPRYSQELLARTLKDVYHADRLVAERYKVKHKHNNEHTGLYQPNGLQITTCAGKKKKFNVIYEIYVNSEEM